MSKRKRVNADEYLAAHNRELKRHPKYRDDMKFTRVDAKGDLVLMTQDPVIAAEDKKVFDEVCKKVAQRYDLIIP